MLSKFGQEVRLEIYSDKELQNQVYTTEGLRVDFHVKIIPGMNRAKFTIYNLNSQTSKEVTNGQKYIKLFTRLHGRNEQEFPFSFFVNNAMNVKQVPNLLTELYCIDSLRSTFSQKQIQMQVSNPTLPRVCREIANAAGQNIVFDFSSIPDEMLQYKPAKPVAVWSGQAMEALQEVAKTYGAEVYTGEGNTVKFVWVPLDVNQKFSKQNDPTKYKKLKTIDMRTNPRIGIANMEIDSNLDLDIEAGTLFDTSELLTASSLESDDTLNILNNAIKNQMSGNSIYQVLTVEHKGSNYADQWTTSAMAVKAYKGTTIPTYGWY